MSNFALKCALNLCLASSLPSYPLPTETRANYSNYGRPVRRRSINDYGAYSHSRQQPDSHYWLEARMLTYEQGYWQAPC